MFTLKLIFHDFKTKTIVYFLMPKNFLQNQRFLKKIFFEFVVISQEVFELQKRIIPHFSSLEKWFDLML